MAPVAAREAQERLRSQLASHGVKGLRKIVSAFRRMDVDGEHRAETAAAKHLVEGGPQRV